MKIEKSFDFAVKHMGIGLLLALLYMLALTGAMSYVVYKVVVGRPL